MLTSSKKPLSEAVLELIAKLESTPKKSKENITTIPPTKQQHLTLSTGYDSCFYEVPIEHLFSESELKPLANDLYLIMQPDSYKFEVDYANEKTTKHGTKYCGIKPLELVTDNWLESAKEALKAFRETYPPELLKASTKYLDEDTKKSLFDLVVEINNEKNNKAETKKTLSTSKELINGNESKKTLSTSEELITGNESKETLSTSKELINDNECKKTLSTSEDLTSGNESKETLSTSKELLNENETKETLSTLVETTDSLKTNNSESKKTLSASEELINNSETKKTLSISKELVNGNESKKTLSTSKELINSNETKETLLTPKEVITDKKYQLVNNNETLKEAITLLSKENVLGIDIEKTGLDVHIHKLRLISIASPKNPTIIIDCYKCDIKLIQPLLLNDSIKVFNDAKVALKFFLALGLEVKQNLFDTMLAYQLINAGKDNLKSSLKEITKELLNIDLNKDEEVSDWLSDTLTDNHLTYASKKAEVLLTLRDNLKHQLIQLDLTKVAKIEFDCIHAVAMMEVNGILLNLEKWNKALKDTQVKLNNVSNKLKDFLTIENQNNTLFELKKELNLNSPQQVLEALQNLGINLSDTKVNTLKNLAPDYEVVTLLLEHRKLAKLSSSFGDSLTKKINPITGRLHPNYFQNGSSAGRFSCGNPNLQQIPRSKEVRECFIASPGNKLVIADYSQIELRIAAEIANDKTMIDAYKNGEDLHKLTASIILNKPLEEVTKGDRQIAKSANFGLIYGSSVQGFRSYAESNYGISLTESQAKTIKDNFFKSYSGLAKWHEQTKKTLYSQRLTETRTLSNRRRLFTKVSHQQALNSPIQGTGADILKLALARLPMALKDSKAKIIGTVHDEIILEVDEGEVNQVAKILTEVMETAGKEFLTKIPVIAEASICDDWSEK